MPQRGSGKYQKTSAIYYKNNYKYLLSNMVRKIVLKGIKKWSDISFENEKRDILRVKNQLFGRLMEEEREKVMLILIGFFGRLTYEDIEEVYSDGCLLVWNKMTNGELELKNTSLMGYLVGTCKNIGRHYLRKVRDDVVSLDELMNRNVECVGDEEGLAGMFDIIDEVECENEEKLDKLNEIWEKLSDVDRMILESYYWDGCKMEEIARRVGYKSADSVKSKKNKILRKMMEMMKKEEGSNSLPSFVISLEQEVCEWLYVA